MLRHTQLFFVIVFESHALVFFESLRFKASKKHILNLLQSNQLSKKAKHIHIKNIRQKIATK